MKHKRPLTSKKEDIYTNYSLKILMRPIRLFFMIFIIILFFIPVVNSYSMRGGDIYLIRPESTYIDDAYVPPEYLSVEDLVFYTCIEEDDIPIKSTTICLDDNSFKDVEVVKWLDDENCYIGAYNLDGKDCKQMLIQSEYLKDEELVVLQKEIKVNRLSSILDLITRNQYSDGGWKNSVESAAGLWVLSNSREIFDDEIELGLEWIKLNRNNEFKCWPEEDCSVYTTAKIMAYLSLAGYNDTHRVVHDGNIFLEKNQNYYVEEDLWDLDIKPFDPGDTECIISYENNLYNEDNFTLAENKVVTYEISPIPNEDLIIICDQNFQANLTTQDNELVFIYEGDNMSYKTPYNCWSNDHKWGECDLTTSILALFSNISDEHKELAHEYLESELRIERSGEMYLGEEMNVSDSTLYAYIADNDNVTSWVRYKQNNVGSWGNGTNMENVIPTGYGLLGLLGSGFNRTDEVIEDAEKWVNEKEIEFTLNITEDYIAWNSTEKNAMAFIVLKNNARPVIKSNPTLILIDKESTELELFNPTTYELEEISFEFSENLQDILEIEEQEYISSYSYIRVDITKKVADLGNIFGHLSVYNFEKELGRIPVMISNFPKIEISSKSDNLKVFGTSATAEFDIIKTGHSFDCTLTWDENDISSKEDFTITSNSLSVDLAFDSPERVEMTYNGIFECTSGDYSLKTPFGISISRYATFPFSVTPDSIFINQSGVDKNFIIENNLDETLDVSANFLKNSVDFELSKKNFAIDPNNKINITIYNDVVPNMNLTTTNVIEITALGQKKNIDFRAITITTPEKTFNPLVLWIILLIIVICLGVGGFFAYKYRTVLINMFKKGNKIDAIKMKIKKLEEKEKNTAIMNMINILRILKKDDVQIRTRLKAESFTDEEVDKALKEEAKDEEGEETNDNDLFG